jgi:hypothetical protein
MKSGISVTSPNAILTHGFQGNPRSVRFDIEYVAIASMADFAACKDAASRDTLAMMGLALDHHFRNHRPIATAVP